MIRKLSKSIRQFKRQTILGPLFIMTEAIINTIIPLIMAKLIDEGINASDGGNILMYGITLIIASSLSLTLGIFAAKNSAEASAGFAMNLRQDMFYNIQRFSFTSIDKFSSSSLITRLTSDITNVQQSFLVIVRVAMRAPATLTFALIMSFSVNAKLAMSFLYIAPLLAIGLLVIVKFAYPVFKRVFKLYDKLNNVVQENLRGIRPIKAYVRKEYEEDKFNDVSNDIYNNFCKAEKLISFNAPLMNFCIFSCMLAISWFGARIIVETNSVELTTGELMGFFTYTMQILSSLMMLSMVFVMITMSKASAERIVEVLDEKSDIVSPENAITTLENGDITFENVSFGYSKDAEKYCLKNINISIKEGETIGIIGGTGSSKSSLVQLIPRLYDANEGIVKVSSHDVREYDLDVLRNNVAMVLQKNELFSGTLKENLLWGNEFATDEEINKVCEISAVNEFLHKFEQGLDTHIEQGGANVSGGQKQRICIARALLKQPKILILDDSTSAVDTATENSIKTSLKDYMPSTTKIIIAQRISSVFDADKIIVLDDGVVTGFAPHDELMENNIIYREVYESQNKGGIKE